MNICEQKVKMLTWSSRVRLAAARTRDQRKRICIRDDIISPTSCIIRGLCSLFEKDLKLCVCVAHQSKQPKRTNLPTNQSLSQPVKEFINQQVNGRKSRVVTSRNHSQLKAALQSRQTIREADVVGRPVAKHAPQSSAAGSNSNKKIPVGVTCGQWMQSRGCTYGARDAPIATHAYDNTHTQTPLTYTPTNLSHVHVHTHADQRVACGGHVLRLRSRSSFVCVGKCCWWHRNALANGIVVVIVAVAVVASLLLPLLLSA